MALSHGYVLALAAFAFSAPSLYRGYMRLAIRRHPAYGLDIVTDLTDSEIVGTYGGTVERFAYTAIGAIDDRPDHLLFWIAKRRAVVLPKRALAGVASVSAVRDHVEKARAAMSVEDEGTHAQDTQSSLVRMPWENFQKWLTTWYGRPPRTPPRMARERTLPPGSEMRASDRDADPRPAKDLK